MKCKNRRCNRLIPEDAKYCPYCGKSQAPKQVKHKRPNGTGSIYKRSNVISTPYVAVTPAKYAGAYKEKGQIIGTFATEEEAQQALYNYQLSPTTRLNITLEQLHDEWQKIAYRGISDALINNWDAAWYKLRTLYKRKFRELRTGEMQQVIDYYSGEHPQEGPGGKIVIDKETGKPKMREALSSSSLEKVKALLTSLFDYAVQNDIVNKNYASFINLPPKKKSDKKRFTDLDLQVMESNIGQVPYADVIFTMCYVGYRVSAFLALTRFSVREVDGYRVLIGGNKTDAGRDCIVPIHPKIAPIIDTWLAKGGETIFCKEDGSAMSANYFRTECYYPALQAMDLPMYSPHATRRTFSTRLSAAGVREEDIIALVGHTSIQVDRESYINQETKTLASAIKRLG